MSDKEAFSGTKSFIEPVKKCIAESDEIEPKYKDAVIQTLQDGADEFFSMPEEEMRKAVEYVKSLNIDEDELREATVHLLMKGIENQIAGFKKYEENDNE